MELTGKGFFIWQIPFCEDGDVEKIADLAQEAQLSHVLIKIADTKYRYQIYEGEDKAPPLVNALRKRDIAVWGWQYVKGDDPTGEADQAIRRVKQFNLDGFVIDAEVEYKKEGKNKAAARYMKRLRDSLPNTPIALSSYRYPSIHGQLPWREFLEGCDYNMPQVYWMLADNPGEQLRRCVSDFREIEPFRPVIPTGAAYRERGWEPMPEQVLEFLETAKELNLSAVNFYSWDSSRKYLPQVWNVIRDYDWSPGRTTSDISVRFIAALNSRDPERVLTFYKPNAVHVTAARTVQGVQALRAWYQTLFSQLLPGANFRLSGFTGSGSSRHLTWTANSERGRVNNGRDTLGLIDDKIMYHYSFFNVT